jgi:GT2 family glycosyltransferase
MDITVIVPTCNRAECVRRNIVALSEQEPKLQRVIIVDASDDDRTENVVRSALTTRLPFELLYRRNPEGRGNTPHSRNLGLLEACGEIVAFLDDDAFVRPGWARALVDTYADPGVAGVGGRALNGLPGEDLINTEEVGRLLADGTLTGNFNSNPGRILSVDHMIGCNMSMRRDAIAQLGGFKDDFRAGPFGICEETEICIRARRLGLRLVFNPAACADHIGAPQPGGRRFSPKYSYYHAKNNLVMVIRNYGVGLMAARHIRVVGCTALVGAARKTAGAIARSLCAMAGLIVGLVVGLRFVLRSGTDPVRRGSSGTVARISDV